MTGDTLTTGLAAALWCRKCGLPCRVEGDPELGMAVHDETGAERGPDGHYCAPIDTETTVMRAAREIAEEYADWLDVKLIYGTLVSAAALNGSPAAHWEDSDGDRLRTRLDAALPADAAAAARLARAARARWEALKALHPEGELDRDDNSGHGKIVRGRLAPGLPWTDWARSTERALDDLERMAGGGRVIHLWSAGSASGTAASVQVAVENAAPYLDGDADAVVEQAEVDMLPADFAGSVPAYRRTGNAWRLRMKDGTPSWAPVAGP